MSGDVFTLEQVVAAVDALRRANAPMFDGAHYYVTLHPDVAEEVHLDELTMGRTERVRGAAWSILDHERRRRQLGKRTSRPPARECLDRALRLEEH